MPIYLFLLFRPAHAHTHTHSRYPVSVFPVRVKRLNQRK